jgi:adenosine/AMP kinase
MQIRYSVLDTQAAAEFHDGFQRSTCRPSIGAGHSFILFLGDGFYPLKVLRAARVRIESGS